MRIFLAWIGLSFFVATCVTFCGSPTAYIIDGQYYCFDCGMTTYSMEKVRQLCEKKKISTEACREIYQ